MSNKDQCSTEVQPISFVYFTSRCVWLALGKGS